MKNNRAELYQALQEAKSIAGDTFVVDEQALDHSGLGIKSTSITFFQTVGGYIASMAFLLLMFALNIYKHPPLVLCIGIPLILLSVFQSKLPKIQLPDTIGVFIFIIGCFLTIYGASLYSLNHNVLIGLVMLISLGSLVLTENKIVVFSSVLIFFGSMIAFMLENNWENGIHMVSNLSILLAFFLYRKEGEILSERNRISPLISTIAYASAIASLISFQIIAWPSIMNFQTHLLWLSSLAPLLISGYLIYKNTGGHKIASVIALVSLAAPAFFAPAIVGSLAILLLGFGYNNRDLLTIGILSFIYTTIRFYYDLKFTLLDKSMMMMAIGIMLFAAYWAFNKYVRNDEKG